MPQPAFAFRSVASSGTAPGAGRQPCRFRVSVDAGTGTPADGSDLGVVYQTADLSWTAEWDNKPDDPAIAMPGFDTRESAASVLYWFARPAQSLRSRPVGQHTPVREEGAVDLSRCGCCVSNDCGCEGMTRISSNHGAPQTYELYPSLIPRPGVLVSLLPMAGGDFLVDCNTWGCGSGMGYLQRLEDGTYELRMGDRPVGRTSSPETGMWKCLQLHTATSRYGQLVRNFKTYPKPSPVPDIAGCGGTRIVPVGYRFPDRGVVERVNLGAVFHPQTGSNDLPFVEVDGVAVFAYLDYQAGVFRVSVDRSTAAARLMRPDGTVPLCVEVDEAVVWDDRAEGVSRRGVLGELLAAADDDVQERVIREAAYAAGVLWRCPAHGDNPREATRCEGPGPCRVPKPTKAS